MKSKNGFALVEVIIACGVLGVVAVGVNQLMSTATKSTLKVQVDTDYTLAYNEIIAILSDPKNCEDTLAINKKNPQSIINKGVAKFKIGDPFGVTNSVIANYNVGDPDASNEAKFDITFTKKQMLGAGTIRKSFNLYIKFKPDGSLETCRSLASSDSDLWTRGTGNFSGDVYYSGNVGIGTSEPMGSLHIKTSPTNKNGVLIDSNQDAYLHIRGKSDGSTYSGIYLGKDELAANKDSFFMHYKATLNEPKNGLLIGNWFNNVEQDIMAITKSGRVGIGTNTPETVLHVNWQDAKNPKGVVFQSDKQSFLHLRGNGDGWTKSGLYLGDESPLLAKSFLMAYRSDKDSLLISGYGTEAFWLSRTGNVKISGTITAGGTITSASDIKLKKNVKPLSDSLDKILKLKGVAFDWIDSKMGNKKQIGFIAQDVEKVFPELVLTDEKGMKSVSYQGLTSPLVEAVKEQQLEIIKLKQQNAEMMKEMKELKLLLKKK